MHFNSIGCKKFEFVSVRGYNCSNCTALFGQSDKLHVHIDSYWGSEQRYKCQFTSALAGAVKRPGGEDNFGHYETVNLNHTCMLSDDSTTQWWFGVHELMSFNENRHIWTLTPLLGLGWFRRPPTNLTYKNTAIRIRQIKVIL